jgi:hypothetical protein
MKKHLLTYGAFASILAFGILAACKKENKLPSEDRSLTAGTRVVYGNNAVISDTIIQSGDTLHLTTCNTYFLDGKTYVNPGGVIKIDSGAVIKGIKKTAAADASALVITKGGKIHATGSAAKPITFTSAQAVPATGDWGGVVILGAAPTNQANPRIEGIAANVPPGVSVNYGNALANTGTVNDDSGDFYYVRILYAGAAIAPNDELNSLTLGGVGSGTDIHHVYAAFGADDAFEFFGGTVNAKYLFSRSTNDDNFDFDFGYVGKIQYAVSVVDGGNSYNGDANGIECDNMSQCNPSAIPRTNPQLANFSIIGGNSAKTTGTLHAVRIRRSTNFTMYNSVLMGYDTAISVDNGVCAATTGTFDYNVIHAFAGIKTPSFTIGANNNTFVNTPSNTSVVLINPFGTLCAGIGAFDGRPNNSTSPARNGANWGWTTTAPAGFFDATTYRGAFNPATPANDWTAFACRQGCL